MDERTVVVTGASRGIGAAMVEEFTSRGAHVVCCARSEADLDDVAGDRDEVTAVAADVRDEYDVERLMEEAARAGPEPGIDHVVANAAVNHGDPGKTPLDGVSYTVFDDAMRTNVRGAFATVKEAVPHLTDDARVLIPSGEVAREPTAGMGAYAVSKAGAEAVARGFAADLDQPVGVVDPGYVATDLSGGKGRDPEDVAEMFVWAATEADADDLDGGVLELKSWLKEKRSRNR
ncbi:MAG: SDR family oxidoreductase [Halolamina sp.]